MKEISKSDFFETGKEGVRKIITPDDKKIDNLMEMFDIIL